MRDSSLIHIITLLLLKNNFMEEIFAGKRILITGASKGLGAVCFREFAGRGARLAISGRTQRNLEELLKKYEGSRFPYSNCIGFESAL